MFTCTALKRERFLGRQLFQVAATIGIATQYGVDWVLPTWSSSSYFKHLAPQTRLPLHIDEVLSPHDFDKLDRPLANNRYVIDLMGDFHSDRFFGHCENLIRHYLELRPELIDELRSRYAAFLGTGRTCVVVAPIVNAREDATALNRTREFCREAISRVGTDVSFAVMSNDLQWWDAHFDGRHITHLPQHEIVHNFALGLLCHNVIVTDSTFGWWIGWLNRCEPRSIIALRSGSGCYHLEKPAAWTFL